MIGGKYRVIRVLGRGGMGVVYEAENSWTGRRVAVKVLLSDERGAEHTARFLQEARTTATVRHPSVVDVLDMGSDPNTQDLYLVQELLRGETLRERLDRAGPMAPEEAVRVARAVLEGLVAAHALGIVHRDIKPSNVMLVAGDVPSVKLIDFGVAKAAAGDRSTLETSTGQILGTPAYMAPEQLRGERSLDGQVDVWAIGAVLYEALSGRKPFDAANYNLLVHRVLSGPPAPLRTVAEGVPRGLAAVVDRALSPDRAQRFASAAAMLAALDAPEAPDVPDVPQAPDVSIVSAAPVRRPRASRLAVAGVVSLVLASLAAVVLTGHAPWSASSSSLPRSSPVVVPVVVPAAPSPAVVAAAPSSPSRPPDSPDSPAPLAPTGASAVPSRHRATRARTHAPSAPTAPAAPAASSPSPGGRAAVLTPESAYPSQ